MRVSLEQKTDEHPSGSVAATAARRDRPPAPPMRPVALLFDATASALRSETVGEVFDVMEKVVADGMTMICVPHIGAFP